MTPYDLAIVGAGPAGAATACFAAQSGLRVLLLDKARFPRDKVCGDGLTARAVAVLREMGLEAAVNAVGQRITHATLIAPATVMNVPLSAASDYPDYALVVPRLTLDALLVQAATQAGAELREGCEVHDIRSGDSQVTLETTAGTITARWAVVACGAHFKLLRSIGLLEQKPETMVAARAYVSRHASAASAWHLDFGFLTSPGYGWVFPVNGERANVGVGFFRPQRGRAPASVLRKYLRRAETRRALAGEPGPCEIESFPLRTDFLQAPLSRGRIWATGEAAGLVNPLTGEGIDYALESGRIAAAEIIRTLRQHLGVTEAARRYEAALHAYFDPLFHFSHALVPVCSRPLQISLLARLARFRPRLAPRLIQVLLGGGTPPARVDWRLWLRALRRRA